VQALRELAAELNESGITLGIARASHLLHHDLKHGCLLDQLQPDDLFASVEDAVTKLQPSPEPCRSREEVAGRGSLTLRFDR
jgi:hypothetical protein